MNWNHCFKGRTSGYLLQNWIQIKQEKAVITVINAGRLGSLLKKQNEWVSASEKWLKWNLQDDWVPCLKRRTCGYLRWFFNKYTMHRIWAEQIEEDFDNVRQLEAGHIQCCLQKPYIVPVLMFFKYQELKFLWVIT